jgi:molecular chaperone HtpG
MHISSEGLNSLISGKNDEIRIREFDNQTWKELWESFLDEARRFGDDEKKNIIGNIDWEFKNPEINHKDKLTGEDKKLIGEFVRRYHPRIAHEIALNGFPTKDINIPFASDLEFNLRNLSGLIARSHGTEIRSTFEYLRINFQDTWSRPYNLELIFLMAVLRVADFLQIDSSRINNLTIKLKSFSSPISEYETYKHLDIKYIQPFAKDPETLVVQCEPRNSLVFIKLQQLLSDIQKEFDTSWAVIGEIYGKEIKVKQPAIKFRRIKSNIDNVLAYSKTVNYIPEKNQFNVSKELPKLLIGPLYGNDPTYGIRELIQNAIDSCREREFLEGVGYQGLVKVILTQKEKQFYFEIEDNGIGMNLNVIKNYFLHVGSSFRKSDLWKKEFSDEEGNSKVQRSGKFGIGVLAAFLVGSKITLETKSIKSPIGLTFQTELNTNQIEILKITDKSVGTKIIIPTTIDIINQLKLSEYSFDKWYSHSSPLIKYIDQTKLIKRKLGYAKYAPGFNDLISSEWHQLEKTEFNKILWTYNSDFYELGDASALTCNGIVIPEGINSFKSYLLSMENLDFNLPYISIFDFNGKLSLNLSRNKIDGDISFEKVLIKDIFKDLIKNLIYLIFLFPFLEMNSQ